MKTLKVTVGGMSFLLLNIPAAKAVKRALEVADETGGVVAIL